MSGKKISVKSENKAGELPCVVFDGLVGKSTKGLVVIQEWWGMNEQIQKEADDIGKMGQFVTIVPDLYRGKLAKDNEEAGHLMNNLDWLGAVQDIKAAAKHLKSLGCNKVCILFRRGSRNFFQGEGGGVRLFRKNSTLDLFLSTTRNV
jgi:carboxymethylenebutenolidase